MNPMEIQKVIRQFLCKWLSCMTKLLCDFSKFITSSKLDSYSLGDDFFSWGGNSQFSLKFVWFAYLGFGLGQIHLPLTNGPSVKCVLFKKFFFHLNSMKIGEVVVSNCTTTSLSFIEFEWKTKIFFNDTFNWR